MDSIKAAFNESADVVCISRGRFPEWLTSGGSSGVIIPDCNHMQTGRKNGCSDHGSKADELVQKMGEEHRRSWCRNCRAKRVGRMRSRRYRAPGRNGGL